MLVARRTWETSIEWYNRIPVHVLEHVHVCVCRCKGRSYYECANVRNVMYIAGMLTVIYLPGLQYSGGTSL